MRTPTGEYRVDFYNKYGERIPCVSLQARTLSQSTEFATERLEEPGMLGASYTIMRAMFNSLDQV